jgi:hypothetical protein
MLTIFRIISLLKLKKQIEEQGMKPTLLYAILKQIYPMMRPMLYDAIDNPNYEWDDLVMSIVDRIFLYDAED